MSNKLEKAIEWCIYQSRWLQVPVYLGMCVVMAQVQHRTAIPSAGVA